MYWRGASSSSSPPSLSSSSFGKGSHFYLVESKHDVKCPRVSRIISRRIYSFRRRESVRRRDSSSGASSLPSSRQVHSASMESSTNETEFSPEKLALPDLKQTLSRFSIEHSTRRIRSSDPQISFQCNAMSKSSIVHHNLIKRRYSVPETVMRKHKLHETVSKSKSIDVCTTSTEPPPSSQPCLSENKHKDESCQTDSIKQAPSHNLNRIHISSKCRRRDGNNCIHCFKRCASYCQYRKRAQRDKYNQPFKLPPIENGHGTIRQPVTTTHDSCRSHLNSSLDNSNDGDIPVLRAPSYTPRTFLLSRHQTRPSLNTLDYGETFDLKNASLKPSPQQSQNVFDSCPMRIISHPDSGKSVDQNTKLEGGNSTANETPHPIDNSKCAKNGDVFPITFHSESVFLHPYEKGGFLSHKELHHISIRVVPNGDTFKSLEMESASGVDQFRTEINDNDAVAADPRSNVEIAPNWQAATSVGTPPPPYPDCSVPTDDYPFAGKPSKLQIQVDVTNVGLSDSFCKPNSSGEDDSIICQQRSHIRLPSNKYSTKATWNYLFQKLCDSYPKRQSLKPATIQKSQVGGVYYSTLPSPIPATSGYNTEAPPPLDEASSDSETSIADSLEDIPTATQTKSNLYEKHDARLARGEVSLKMREKCECRTPSPHDGASVAYFLPLEPRATANDHFTSIKMPHKLEMKLKSRQRCLPKHDLCFDGDSKKINANWRRSRRKKEKNNASGSSKTGSKLDEAIANVLLDGLKMQDGGTKSKWNNNAKDSDMKQTSKMTFTRSAQTDRPATESCPNRIVSEYMETIKMSSPVTDEILTGDDIYEMLQSEEEMARIDSTNYYRSIKKCRKIYRPIKKPSQSGSTIGTAANTAANLRARKFDGDQESRVLTAAFRNLRAAKKTGKNSFRGGQTTRISACRFRPFCQQFEAIPEEMTNGSQEKVTANREVPVEEKNSTNNSAKNEQNDGNEMKPDANGEDTVAIMARQSNTNENCRPKDEAKSQKGRDSLSLVDEHKQLITLSKGWINFYLLNGNANDDENNTDEEDDLGEKISTVTEEMHRVSPQYIIHVHAKPEIQAGNTPSQTMATTSTILPGICNVSPKCDDQKPFASRSKPSSGTNLPSIHGPSSTSQSTRTTRSTPICLHKTRSGDEILPKLDSNSDGPADLMVNRQKCENADENKHHRGLELVTQQEPVSNLNSLECENFASTTISSSNQSESSVEEIRPCRKGRHRKLQKHHRPRTYDYDPIKRDNRWSLTIEGSEHDDKRPIAPNIEMQLSLKNRTGTRSNQSWKFSITNEETSRTNDIEETNGRYLPHLNVNYRVPFPICYDENIKYSQRNSHNNSALSLRGRRSIVETCSDQRLNNISRFDSDLRLHIRKSEDDLTVTGSTITPERKPRVPTMSERDLYRMKLIKQSNTQII